MTMTFGNLFQIFPFEYDFDGSFISLARSGIVYGEYLISVRLVLPVLPYSNCPRV